MTFSILLASIAAAAGFTLTLAVLVRELRSLANLSFAAGMTAFALESVFEAVTLHAQVVDESLRWQTWSLRLMAVQPGFWLAFSLTYSRGNYREFLSRWQLVIVAAIALPVLLVSSSGQNLLTVHMENGAFYMRLSRQGSLLHMLYLIGSVLVLMNLERTFRSAVGTMRWRLKFMMLGLGVLFIFRIYTASQTLLFSSTGESLKVLNSGALLVAAALIAISLFRTKPFSVDIYPSHAVLHNSLTVVLAGIYLVVVGGLAKLMDSVAGYAALPVKAFLILASLVLLTVLLLSDRIRQRTRRFVSRNFSRPIYNYRQIWSTFTERTSSLMDEVALSRAVSKWVSEVFSALSVTVWLVDSKSESLCFGASTLLSENQASKLLTEETEGSEWLAALKEQSLPVDIENSQEDWALSLKRISPGQFPEKGGNRICVPLATGGEVLGTMVLGDRVSGVPFSEEDLDLLKCIGDQVAAALMNVQLSNKLMQAKEMEAFQAMSTFFVHDLKNTASTLSLMLQNLDTHFQNPEFRADALRAVGKSVAHLNGLISRLTVLRQGFKIHKAEADLSKVVETAMAGLTAAPQVTVVKSLEPSLKVQLDPEQIQKVIINLVLNSQEAFMGKPGEITVTTERRPGWVVLSVRDNGCGMSPDFVAKNLFRPFQTTKKKGLGIGMFHSKVIVDAHRGKLEVESAPGQGTLIRLLLPTG